MSYLYALSALNWDWVLLGGGLGGALNAVSSSNLQLFPAWARDAAGARSGRVIRVGLLVSSIVGAATSLGLIWSLRGIATFDAVRPDEGLTRLVGTSLCIGFIAARGLTNEVDKVLLRIAVRNAASAPAAHPEIAAAITHAPPYAVYKIAVDLLPRRRTTPPGQIHVGAAFDKAQPQRS